MKTVLLFVLSFLGVSAITLNKGRYEDVYIVIQDSVPELPQLIGRIKVSCMGSTIIIYFVAFFYIKKTYYRPLSLEILCNEYAT